MSLRRGISAILEAPLALPGWSGLPLIRDPVRRLRLPDGAFVIGVGGATLGGSGRTPLAIGLAEALASRGWSTALVGHGYGGRRGLARRVGVRSSVRDVGDDAWLASRALGGVPVVVGPREDALRLARGLGEVLVVDRLLQTRPRRLHLSLLAVDADRPWSSGRVFPLGDLLAPERVLVAAADEVVAIGGPDAAVQADVPGAPVGEAFGLVTSCARPGRVLRTLPLGASPMFHVKRPDHAPFGRGEIARLVSRSGSLDSWWLDGKSYAGWVDVGRPPLGATVREIQLSVRPSNRLLDRIEVSIRASIAPR